MFSRIELEHMEDYFIPCKQRKIKGVYVNRLDQYNEKVDLFIQKYISYTLKYGVCIYGRIENPIESQLRYYDEMLGRDYQLSPDYFLQALHKWLPRGDKEKLQAIAYCFYDIFIEMARQGKNENIQKNTYIKFMCWLYYKFEAILKRSDSGDCPKLLFQGLVNRHELWMLHVLAMTGCDVLLLEAGTDTEYLKIDIENKYSTLIRCEGEKFPADYSILRIQRRLLEEQSRPGQTSRQPAAQPKLLRFDPHPVIQPNAWLTRDVMEEIYQPQTKRGKDDAIYYNIFAGIYGTEDTEHYEANLLKWKLKIENLNKKLILTEGEMKNPTFDEVNSIPRKNYQTPAAMVNDLAAMIQCHDNKIASFAKASFVEEIKQDLQLPLQKLYNKAVALVCLMNRYSRDLVFDREQVPVFLLYGNLSGVFDRHVLNMMSRLPVDVLHINPDLADGSRMDSRFFFPVTYSQSLKRKPFPQSVAQVQFQTVAYQAEAELNTLIYEDTGLFKNQQFKAAYAVPIQITYDEIGIYWGQEAKYRPNFEVLADKVMIPVIFSKISGVNTTIEEYWNLIADFTEQKDVYVIAGLPYAATKGVNPFKEKAYQFFEQGQLNTQKLKAYSSYPFSFLRESMQDFLLLKLNELIASKLIKGTFVNGMEYTIAATGLNLDKVLLRMIQKYDFTKNIPKLIVIHTRDVTVPVEDSILFAYLTMIGFDIVLFVPTGYVSVEAYYTKPLLLEHQIGEYRYDLAMPDLEELKRKRNRIVNKLFRRGK